MISASDRENAVLLIDEAIKSGASCKKACERLEITERTFYRWKKRKADTDPMKMDVQAQIIQTFLIRYPQRYAVKS